MSTNARLGLLGVVVAVAIAGFVIASSSGGGTKVTTGTAEVVVVAGKPQGGIKTVRFQKGSEVSIRVTSDVGDEVHVHGYNLRQEVVPGRPVVFRFPATLQGAFEVELERRSERIASLQVQ